MTDDSYGRSSIIVCKNQKNSYKNIDFKPGTFVMAGKDGRNLQPDLVTKYSLSVTTCLLQIQKGLQKVSALVQVMRS